MAFDIKNQVLFSSFFMMWNDEQEELFFKKRLNVIETLFLDVSIIRQRMLFEVNCQIQISNFKFSVNFKFSLLSKLWKLSLHGKWLQFVNNLLPNFIHALKSCSWTSTEACLISSSSSVISLCINFSDRVWSKNKTSFFFSSIWIRNILRLMFVKSCSVSRVT